MKKKSAIRQMLYGEICRTHNKPTQEYWKLSNALSKKEKELRTKLEAFCPELLALCDEIEKETGLLYAESEDHYFSEGFQFGLRMGLEVFGKAFHNKSE